LPRPRRARDDAERLIAGVNPLAAKREAKQATSPEDTFRTIAEDYVVRIEQETCADTTITETKRQQLARRSLLSCAKARAAGLTRGRNA